MHITENRWNILLSAVYANTGQLPLKVKILYLIAECTHLNIDLI